MNSFSIFVHLCRIVFKEQATIQGLVLLCPLGNAFFMSSLEEVSILPTAADSCIGLWRESGSDGHLWDPCDTTLTGDDHSLGSDDWNSGSNKWAWTDDDTTACRSQIFKFPINGNVFGYGEECEEIWVPTYAAGQLADATDDGSCSLTSSSNWSDDGEKGFTTYDVSDASVEEGLQRIVDNSRRRDGQSFKMQGSVLFRMTSMDDVWVSWSL